MKFTYYPQGTCSSQIDFELDEQNVIRDVQFTGGCHGNLQGISVLVRGMAAQMAATWRTPQGLVKLSPEYHSHVRRAFSGSVTPSQIGKVSRVRSEDV